LRGFIHFEEPEAFRKAGLIGSERDEHHERREEKQFSSFL